MERSPEGRHIPSTTPRGCGDGPTRHTVKKRTYGRRWGLVGCAAAKLRNCAPPDLCCQGICMLEVGACKGGTTRRVQRGTSQKLHKTRGMPVWWMYLIHHHFLPGSLSKSTIRDAIPCPHQVGSTRPYRPRWGSPRGVRMGDIGRPLPSFRQSVIVRKSSTHRTPNAGAWMGAFSVHVPDVRHMIAVAYTLALPGIRRCVWVKGNGRRWPSLGWLAPTPVPYVAIKERIEIPNRCPIYREKPLLCGLFSAFFPWVE